MRTLEEVFRLSVQYLDQRSISRSKFLVQQLLTHVLSVSKLDLFMQFDKPLTELELQEVRLNLSLLGRGKPIEQIMGYVDFFGSRIEVTSDVLIPRPETELLVDIIAKDLSALNPKEAWDVCTGSGCIGISLKKIYPTTRVSIADISLKALDVARKNAKNASVVLEVIESDLLSAFAGRRADLIVCNPPYISTKDCANLDPSVKDYEPMLALDGGEDGLSFYRRLNRDLRDYLNPAGKVYFEIGFDQGAALMEMFSGDEWVKKRVIKDLSGHDRFFFLEIE